MLSLKDKRDFYNSIPKPEDEVTHLSVDKKLKPFKVDIVNEGNILCWKITGVKPKFFVGGLYVQSDVLLVTCQECLELIHA